MGNRYFLLMNLEDEVQKEGPCFSFPLTLLCNPTSLQQHHRVVMTIHPSILFVLVLLSCNLALGKFLLLAMVSFTPL